MSQNRKLAFKPNRVALPSMNTSPKVYESNPQQDRLLDLMNQMVKQQKSNNELLKKAIPGTVSHVSSGHKKKNSSTEMYGSYPVRLRSIHARDEKEIYDEDIGQTQTKFKTLNLEKNKLVRSDDGKSPRYPKGMAVGGHIQQYQAAEESLPLEKVEMPMSSEEDVRFDSELSPNYITGNRASNQAGLLQSIDNILKRMERRIESDEMKPLEGIYNILTKIEKKLDSTEPTYAEMLVATLKSIDQKMGNSGTLSAETTERMPTNSGSRIRTNDDDKLEKIGSILEKMEQRIDNNETKVLEKMALSLKNMEKIMEVGRIENHSQRTLQTSSTNVEKVEKNDKTQKAKKTQKGLEKSGLGANDELVGIFKDIQTYIKKNQEGHKQLIQQIQSLHATMKVAKSVEPVKAKEQKKEEKKFSQKRQVIHDQVKENSLDGIVQVISGSSKNIRRSVRLSKIDSDSELPKAEKTLLDTVVDGAFGKPNSNSQDDKFKSMKQYTRLNEIQPHCDRRDIKVGVSLIDMLRNSGITDISDDEHFELYLTEWLGVTYRTTASICWNMLQSHQLNFDEVKILFTENIIFNFIELMKNIKELKLTKFEAKVPEIVNVKSIKVLAFLVKQYPQTKIEAPNVALRDCIPKFDEKGKGEYELIGRSQVDFRKKRKGNDYASEIMRFINYLIDITNDHYAYFEEYMNNLFGKLFIPPHERNTEQKVEKSTQNTAQHDKNAEKKAERSQAYKEKVKIYTKYLIGRKIPKNAPKYTQDEIQNGIFFIKSPKILRVISKWLEDLTQIVQKPDEHIRDWFYPFKKHDGSQIFSLYPVRKGIYSEIKRNRRKLEEKLEQIRKECYRIEGVLAEEEHITDPEHIHLSEEQTNVGLYASNIRNALSSYLCQQLNEILHFLLTCPEEVNVGSLGLDKQIQSKIQDELKNINLVTFRIFDLLRCKCVSGEEEIIWLVEELERRANASSLNYDKKNPNSNQLSIVRFKDRLSLGSRDIMINGQLGKGPVFQIQLSVANQIEEKQDLLDKYNHFLYQLKRSTMLGPLMENISIWGSLEQRASYFDDIFFKKFKNTKIFPYTHKCQVSTNFKLEKIASPIVCVSCKTFYHIPRACFLPRECNKCKETVCGQCLYAGMNEKQRKEELFVYDKKKIISNEILDALTEYVPEPDKEFPKHAFFFKKGMLKPDLGFLTSYEVQDRDDQKYKKAVQTVIKNGNVVHRDLLYGQNTNLTKNLIVFELGSDLKIEKMSLDEIMDLDEEQNKKVVYLELLKEPNYIENLFEITTLKDKQKYMEDLRTKLKNGTEEDMKIEFIRETQGQDKEKKETLILLRPHLSEEELERQLNITVNLERLKKFAESNSSVVNIEKKKMSTEMDMLQQTIGPRLYANMCKHLFKLYLNFGEIQSIKSLKKMVNLKSLYISDNKITSLQGIQTMTQLEVLNFDRNEISSLVPLKDLVRLENISANHNKLTSLNGIQNLKCLVELSVLQNQITKMEFMEQLSNLENLFMKKNLITQLTNLEGLKKLKKLSMVDNPIQEDPQIPSCLKELQMVSFREMNLLRVPQTFTKLKLKQLFLNKNRITKIEFLSEQDQLRFLDLSFNLISKIEGLNDLKLTHLIIDDNQIKEVTGIHTFIHHLELLSIKNNPINNCGQLTACQINFKIKHTPESMSERAAQEMELIINGHKGFSNRNIIISKFLTKEDPIKPLSEQNPNKPQQIQNNPDETKKKSGLFSMFS